MRQADASDAIGDDIGGPKWSSPKTLLFVVGASGGLWSMIGVVAYFVLRG